MHYDNELALPAQIARLRSFFLVAFFRWLMAALLLVCTAPCSAQHEDHWELDSAKAGIRNGKAEQTVMLLKPFIERPSILRDTASLVIALGHLSRATYDLGDMSAALHYTERGIALGHATNDYKALGTAYNRLAIVADQFSPRDSVKHLYERALSYFLMAGDTAACALVYDNLGFYPMAENDFATAIAFSEKGLTCLKDTTDELYHRSAAMIESSLNNYYSWSGDPQKGVQHGLLSIHHAQLSHDYPMMVHCNTQLADAYYRARDYRHALPLLLRSDSLARARSMPLNKRRDIPEILSYVYEAMGDPLKALYYYKQRSAVHDSLRNDASQSQLRRMEKVQLHLTDSLAQVVALRDQAVVSERTLGLERDRRNVIGLLALVGLVIAVAIWSRLRLLRRTNAQILDAQQALLESERRREAEHVRTKIARDVHDDLGSDLTRITFLAAEVRSRAKGEGSALLEAVDRISALSKQVGATFGDIVWAVNPQHDTVQGLIDQARKYAGRMLVDSGITADLTFAHVGPDRMLDPATKRDIFLVLKEALNNVLKHAKATHVIVSLKTVEDRFELRIQDDGIGFDPKWVEEGNGSKSMRERSSRIGVQYVRTSTKGQGCEVLMSGTFT